MCWNSSSDTPTCGPGWSRCFVTRLRATDRQMAEVAMQQLPVRLAKALLRMTYVETLSRPTDRVQVSQRELGNIVGAARESVNKCLNEMAAIGLGAYRANIDRHLGSGYP